MAAAEMLAEAFEAEARSARRRADTFDGKAESIAVEHDLAERVPNSRYDHYGDLVRYARSSADGARKQASRAAYRARVIRDLVEQVTKGGSLA